MSVGYFTSVPKDAFDEESGISSCKIVDAIDASDLSLLTATVSSVVEVDVVVIVVLGMVLWRLVR